MKDAVTVANSQPRVHHRAFADFGSDVAHLNCVSGRFLGEARAVGNGRQPCRNHGSQGERMKPRENRICPSILHERHWERPLEQDHEETSRRAAGG
jgi:hypothetical protein